jgi:hypothetical protein
VMMRPAGNYFSKKPSLSCSARRALARAQLARVTWFPAGRSVMAVRLETNAHTSGRCVDRNVLLRYPTPTRR